MNYQDLDLFILKAITTNKKIAIDFSNECSEKLFSTDLWRFAKFVIDYVKTYKEVPTKRVINEKLKTNEVFLKYMENILEKLDAVNYDEKEYKHDLEKLKERFAKKLIYNFKDTIQDEEIDVNKSIKELQAVVNNVKSLNGVKSYEAKTLKEAIPQFREEYTAKIKNPEFNRGIMCGYKWIDDAIGGFRDGELFIFGGESSSGKSIALLNMAINMWMSKNNLNMESDFYKGENVLYFSLEMPFKACFNRAIAATAEIPARDIRDAKLSEENINKMKKAIKFINNYENQFQIIDCPRGTTSSVIEKIYLEKKDEFNPKILVVDYMGEMSSDNKDESDWKKLEEISSQLHEICRVHNVIIFTAVQLNRVKPSTKDQGEKVGGHRIARSNGIINSANFFMQIETRVQEKNYPTMMMHLIKNREGVQESGELLKNLACCKLYDYKKQETEFFGDISDKI